MLLLLIFGSDRKVAQACVLRPGSIVSLAFRSTRIKDLIAPSHLHRAQTCQHAKFVSLLDRMLIMHRNSVEFPLTTNELVLMK